MGRLTVSGATEVIIGEGLPSPLLPVREQRCRVAILTQPAATSRALEIARLLRAEGLASEVIGLPDREEAKTLEVAKSVYGTLAEQSLTVHDTVVGVGGGSVTDLAGFVAGTWLRGVEVVHFPTTFLGAIDASVGGKTGVNVGGKNLVGVFWHPTRVVVDLTVLSSLPGALIREGMAEALKSGLVGDPTLVDLLAWRGLEAPLDEVVTRALTVKIRLVDLDPLDRAERAFLNFGHTIGHAIEFASPLSHGECVSLGMVAAARISESRTGFGGIEPLIETLTRLGLPVTVKGLDRTRVRDLVRRDKKRDGVGVRMVLLEEVGHPLIAHVDDDDIESSLTAIGL
jgi:3-dehydroquinate synthase